MIYLYTPGEQPRWTKLPEEFIPYLRDPLTNHDAIEWLPADVFEPYSDQLGVALRRGEPVLGGIAVAYQHFNLFRTITVHEEFFRVTEETRPAVEMTDAFIEQTNPGWTEAARRDEAFAAEHSRAKLTEAREELATILAEPISDDVAAHWARLGGSI